jgi:hypothetical protein
MLVCRVLLEHPIVYFCKLVDHSFLALLSGCLTFIFLFFFACNDVAFSYSVRLFAWQLLFLQVLSLAIHHFLSQHPLINSTAIVC